ncbi:Ig-like domain-containing protein [Cytobacillus praedii]|uniref:Ig-like domain-containing protein n=1 Tax=Cytobacillus praedii TaxID=1742358 RepID=UPI002E23AD30|nr:Ig-like domain-containing protein [Cytobacillus praedii]
MSKKRTLKVLSASAIAASAFVTAPAIEAASVSQAEKLVKTAKDAGTVLKWAISIEGTADGKTRPWAAYNAAKSAYDKALKAVNTLPAAQKNRYLAELDQEVKLHITRTMFYIDAITAGEKIKEKQQTLAYQQDLDIINDQTEKAYHELSNEIRKQAILLDRVYGQTTRDLIRSHYKQSAEKVRDASKYPVTVKMELDLAQKALAAKDSVKANKHIQEAKSYLKYIDNTVIKKYLTDRLNTLETSYVPKVVNVSAAEPKRIRVEFNKAMLSGSGTNGAENTSNYSVSGRTVKNVTLTNDKKTAVIELYDPLYTSTSYTVTVKRNIQSANYETLNTVDYTSSFTFSDKQKPTVSTITTQANGNVEIKFSEIIDSGSSLSITVDGKSVTANSVYSDTDTVILPKAELDRIGLRKGRSYSIVISGAKDVVVYTPNTMDTYRSNFMYNPTADTVAPGVRTLQVKDEKTITVEFTETLDAFTASNLVITKGNTTIRPTTVKDVSNGQKTKYDIELPASVYGTNENSVWLNVQVKAYKDLDNNTGSTVDRSVSLTKDLNPPQFVSSLFDANKNEIHLTFNKPLKAVLPVANTITIYDSNDKSINYTVRTNVDNKLIIDAKSLPDGVYLINVADGAVKDNTLSQNNNRAFSTTVTKKTDSVKPQVTLVESTINGQFKAIFSETVNEQTATSPANYTYDGSTLPANTTFTMSADKKLVTITLPEGTIATTKTFNLTARNVKDLSDNVMNVYNSNITLKDNTQPVMMAAARDNNTIKLTFSENIILPDSGQSNFSISVGDLPITTDKYTVRLSSNQRDIIITPGSDDLFATGKLTIQTTNAASIRDGEGNLIKAGITKEISQ